jgi:hypothetical protein
MDLGQRIVDAATLAAKLHRQADLGVAGIMTQFGRRPQTGSTGRDQVMEDLPPGTALH